MEILKPGDLCQALDNEKVSHLKGIELVKKGHVVTVVSHLMSLPGILDSTGHLVLAPDGHLVKAHRSCLKKIRDGDEYDGNQTGSWDLIPFFISNKTQRDKARDYLAEFKKWVAQGMNGVGGIQPEGSKYDS